MKPRSTTRPLSGTRSVLRAISVLKILGCSGSAYGITELGAATGLSKATVFRLIGTLETEGLVARDVATGGYRLGPGLIALGASALSTTDFRTIARDELLRLAEESGEAATLEVMAEGNVLILDEAQGRFLFGATPEIGRSWPAHATSTGTRSKAHLSSRPYIWCLRAGAGGWRSLTPNHLNIVPPRNGPRVAQSRPADGSRPVVVGCSSKVLSA